MSTPQPTFSICHATARTPDGWQASRDAWALSADVPEFVEYLLSVHIEDLPVHTMSRGFLPVIYAGERTSVHGWNVAAERSTGHILILSADDFFPPMHWDTLLIDKIPGDWLVTTEFAIHVSTGTPDVEWDRRLMALGIISRPLYQRWGYVLYPGYESMESDVDMLEHARQDGVVIPAYDLVFEHRHVSLGKSPDDAVYQRQNRPEAYKLGKAVIELRRASGFKSVETTCDCGTPVWASVLGSEDQLLEWYCPVCDCLKRDVNA